MILHLANPLFQHREGLLLYFVTLLEFQKLSFQGLYIGVRRRLYQRRRE